MSDKQLTKGEEEDISRALDKANDTEDQLPDDYTFVTSTGAVIEAVEPPGSMLQRIVAEFPDPEPPMAEINQGSKTWMEPNANDPAYIRKRRRRYILLGEAMMKLSMFKGMVILELPKGQPSYEEDDVWVEEYEALGIEVPSKDQKSARYLEWIRYRILPTTLDMDGLRKVANRLEGIKEEDVEAEMAQFLDNGGRDSDQGVAGKS